VLEALWRPRVTEAGGEALDPSDRPVRGAERQRAGKEAGRVAVEGLGPLSQVRHIGSLSLYRRLCQS
jgi:hypothetical protein